jgi:glucosamine-6-phosphate deaminase
MTAAMTTRVLTTAAAAVPLLLDEVRALQATARRPVVGLATGGTFTPFLAALAVELAQRRLVGEALLWTHLDEYLHFAPTQAGGMVDELLRHCPPLRELLARGSFVPVPSDGGEAGLAAHTERLLRAGGVDLQFLGIGRNGHLAFNEPGTPFHSGFHQTTLAESTRQDARRRFAPAEPPLRAVTSGLATIASARRLVLCAFGEAKAAAVARMLLGPIDEQCPASMLRRHANVLVLLDPAAAARLPQSAADP